MPWYFSISSFLNYSQKRPHCEDSSSDFSSSDSDSDSDSESEEEGPAEKVAKLFPTLPSPPTLTISPPPHYPLAAPQHDASDSLGIVNDRRQSFNERVSGTKPPCGTEPTLQKQTRLQKPKKSVQWADCVETKSQVVSARLNNQYASISVASDERTVLAIRDLTHSEGQHGGLCGDVIYIKAAQNQLSASGFYMVRADGRGYEQLMHQGCRTIWSEDVFGPKAKFQVLDPMISDEAKTIAASVRRIADNTTSTNLNTSLEIGLRAVIRHSSTMLSVDSLMDPTDAVTWTSQMMARSMGKKRKRSTLARQYSDDAHEALQHLKKCWSRCEFGPRDMTAAFNASF